MAKKDLQGNCFDGVIDYLSFTPFYLAFDNFINTYFPNGLFNQYEERYINVIYVEDINLPALGWIDPFSDYIYIGMVNRKLGELVDDNAKVLTHELGHILSLLHPHGDMQNDGCNADPCTGQDMILDTPIGPFIDNMGSGCGIQNQYCNASGFDQSNIMTAKNQPSTTNCNDHFFTQGQMNRMSQDLNNEHTNLFSASNLERTIGLNSQTLAGNIYYNNTTRVNQSFNVLDQSTIYIQGTVTLENCTFDMGSMTKVIVESGARLILDNTHFSSICNRSVWNGIYVELFGRIETLDGSKIDGAKIGIHAENKTTVDIQNTFFRDCEIGIKLGDPTTSGSIINSISSSTFESGVFGNSGPKTSFPRMKYGIAAYNCNSLFVHSLNTFKECDNAIYSVGNWNQIIDNTIRQCDIGVDIDNRASQTYSWLDNNDIITNNCAAPISTCKKPGIRIRGGEAGAIYNEITSSIGMNLIDVRPEPNTLPDRHIYENTFRNCEFRAMDFSSLGYMSVHNNTNGIQTSHVNKIFNSINLDVRNNIMGLERLDLNLVRYSHFEDNLFQNYKSSTDRFNVLYYNSFLGQGDVTSAPYNTYLCNYFGNEFKIKSTSLGSRFTQNLFTDLFSLENRTAQISPQINQGNNFAGVTARYKADLNLLESNLFITKNQAPYVPQTIDGPIGWFDYNNFNPNNCEISETFSDEIWESENIASCVDSLFQGTKYAKFSSQQKWSILLTLYRIYKKRNQAFPFALSPCAQRILLLYTKHTVGKIDRLYEKYDSLHTIRVSGPATDSIYALIHTADNMIAEDAPVDSIKVRWQVVDDYETDRAAEWAVYKYGYDKLKQEILTEADHIASETTIEPFHYLARLMPYLIAHKEDDQAFFTPLRLDYLEEIIQACDSIAGEASYIARGIYESVTGQDLSGITDCDPNPLPRVAATRQPAVKIYPNPAYDRLHIETVGEVTISMINIAGETVVRTSVIDKSAIDTSTLPAGVYFVRIEGAVYAQPQVLKLIKL